MLKATPTVQVRNERVIVTEWRFPPGAQTGHHVHAHDYVVVPITAGTLRLDEPGGTRDVRLEAGGPSAVDDAQRRAPARLLDHHDAMARREPARQKAAGETCTDDDDRGHGD